jgi:predicted nucleotidyltransferase
MELISRTDQIEKAILTATRNGFPYADRLIHLFIGGSGLHGGRVAGKHDDDFYGIYVEPPPQIIGLREYPHYVWSTAGEHQRNQPGDVDITLYGMRKWARLAGGGNPTALGFLYAPNLVYNPYWDSVTDNRLLFAAASHESSFQGFARQQLDRVLGTRGKGKHGQRPELEEKYGYDVKAAMHVIRLLSEGIEYLRTGVITYPRPEKEYLIDIRTGKFTAEQIEKWANGLFNDLERARLESPLPPEVDWDAISAFVVNLYLKHWGFE